MSRNPKDVLVSFYHFHKMANFLPEPGTFPEFLNRFLEGTCELKSRKKDTFIFQCLVTIADFMQLDEMYNILSHLFVPVSYGSWFDHVKEWTSQTATMSNLLHITYEEMSLVKKN